LKRPFALRELRLVSVHEAGAAAGEVDVARTPPAGEACAVRRPSPERWSPAVSHASPSPFSAVRLLGRLSVPLITLAIVAGVLLVLRMAGLGRLDPAVLRAAPHLPDLSLLAAQSLTIKLHLLGAVTALGLGIVQMVGVKGTGLHRVLGWSWVAAMALTAVSSLFIREINRGAFSFIHLLSGWVIIALPMAIVFIRRGHVRLHARFMTGLFVGGLLAAGALAFLPGRLMWRMFFG
jgi:uncharacterized membrane protein